MIVNFKTQPASWIAKGILLSLVIMTCAACSEDNPASTSGVDGGCPPGAEGCPCYDDGACNAGLFCLNNVCLKDRWDGDVDESETDSGDTVEKDETAEEEPYENEVADGDGIDSGESDEDLGELGEPEGDDGDETQATEIGCEVNILVDGGVVTDFDPYAVGEDADLFSLGVMAGSMEKDSVILWTYVEDDQPKTLRVWRDPPYGDGIAVVKSTQVEPTEGYMKEKVTGLAPKTVYYYGFYSGMHPDFLSRSEIGAFKTAFPDDCLAPMTIGGAHGTNPDFALNNDQGFEDLKMIATYEMDAFLQLGDFSYSDNRDHQLCYTIEEFRDRWRFTLTTDGYKELLAAAGQYIVWDDHEVANNTYIEFEEGDLTPEIIGIGHDAFFETTPVERREQGSYWRSFKWGKTAEIFSLDCRSERQPDTRLTGDPIYIGREQMAWLKDALENSDAHFKLIMNSVPITLFGWGMETLGYVATKDRWAGYAAQRNEILDYITDNDIENVWWLTGDFHLGMVARVELDGARSDMWEVMMGPSSSYANPLAALVETGVIPAEMVAPPGQFEHFSGTRAICLMTFDPIADEVHITFINSVTGEMLYDEELSWGG